jgi:hypothetical protein
MTLYEHVEKECLTDGLDFEHRRCNTAKLKAICEQCEKIIGIYYRALNEISGSAFGVPGYQTAHDAAMWMNHRAEGAIVEAIAVETSKIAGCN